MKKGAAKPPFLFQKFSGRVPARKAERPPAAKTVRPEARTAKRADARAGA